MAERVHPVRAVAMRNRAGEQTGLFSVCSANELVLRAAVRYAKKCSRPVIIEATSNQVNQLGGYTGMKPADFAALVKRIVDEEQLDSSLIILGGDHLGPIAWKNSPESEAMAGAREMVRGYALAGFTKIHIDTSMRLGDDDASAPLPVEVSARRGAELAKTVFDAYAELKKRVPDAVRPVLIIGSEVPIPGGSLEHEDFVTPTKPEAFIAQVEEFRAQFERLGLCFDDAVGFVVQPGVEFGDDFVSMYDPENASPLVNALSRFPSLVFEGHSTDYQTSEKLGELVRDGVAILKVGPALTFALREGLFMLEDAVRDYFGDAPRFKDALLEAMDADDRYWKSYYFGTDAEIAYKKVYSYSDRCRYYLPDKEVQVRLAKLLNAFDGALPPALISQYFPRQYTKYMSGQLSGDALSLVCDRVCDALDPYAEACGFKA